MSSSNVLNLAFRGTQVAAMTAEQLVRILAELAEKADASRSRDKFLKLAQENAQDVCAKYFNPSEYDSVKRAFDKSKTFIPMAMYQDSGTNKVICFYMKNDEEKVSEIFAKARATERSLYSSSKMVNEHLGQRLVVVKDLNESQMENLAHYLEENNLAHSVEASKISEGGKMYVVTCLGDTQDRLNVIREGLEKVARDEAGISGKFHAVNMHSSERINEMVTESVRGGDSYIVSASNPKSYIHITAAGFTYINNGKEIESKAKSASTFSRSLYSRIQDMPIPLSYKDNSFMSKSGIDLMREAGDKFNLIPTNTQDRTKLALEEKARALVALKMGLDNGGQYKIHSSFYNSDVSFSEFFAIEQINDAYEAKMGERMSPETLEYYKGLASDLDAANESQKDYVKQYVGDIYERSKDLVNDDRLEEFTPEERVADKDTSLDDYINEIDNDLSDRMDGLDIDEVLE